MDRQIKNSNYGRPTVIAWLAFIFSAIAMFLAIAAFNRTGIEQDRTEGERWDTPQYEKVEDSATTRLRARAELASLRARISANRTGDEIAQEVSEAREKIRTIYENSSDELRGEAGQMDIDLQNIENTVRSNTAQGLQGLENLINRLEMNIRRDE